VNFFVHATDKDEPVYVSCRCSSTMGMYNKNIYYSVQANNPTICPTSKEKRLRNFNWEFLESVLYCNMFSQIMCILLKNEIALNSRSRKKAIKHRILGVFCCFLSFSSHSRVQCCIKHDIIHHGTTQR
jgi:hypothetical protein